VTELVKLTNKLKKDDETKGKKTTRQHKDKENILSDLTQILE
jgi:hypothetical protein